MFDIGLDGDDMMSGFEMPDFNEPSLDDDLATLLTEVAEATVPFDPDSTVDSMAFDASNPAHQVSFGASLPELQISANLSEYAKHFEGTWLGGILDSCADHIAGADESGMEIIKDNVDTISRFYGIDPVKVFYEQGEPGLQFSGFTDAAYDNWIGGDPAELQAYASKYGSDFVTNVIAHEMGHHIVDRVGLEDVISRKQNEACADYLAGIYAGSVGLDPDGFREFLSGQPSGLDTYPDGAERAELFLEGYQTAHGYPFRDFESVLDSTTFDLVGNLTDIANRYA